MLTSKGEIKSEDNCVDFNGIDLYLRECDGLDNNQKWVIKVTDYYEARWIELQTVNLAVIDSIPIRKKLNTSKHFFHCF